MPSRSSALRRSADQSPRLTAPHPLSRRRFLAGLAVVASAPALLAADRKSITPAAAFDDAIETFMKERGTPGGALAVVKDRRLVYARGYGWADREQKLPATPQSLFRIASISKPITAVAVMKLVEEKKLQLDAKVFALLDLGSQVPNGRTLDARWKAITLRQLLHHTAGWDRDQNGDPMFKPLEIARDLGEPGPATAAQVIRWMLGQPLETDPGAHYAYSNFGYCLLGRVIEKAAGQPYEKFVQQHILAPAGSKRMRIGASREAGRADGEVRYYTRNDDQVTSVFPEVKGKVPRPYGGFHLEAMDAHGGWIASAVDLVRFTAALDAAAPRPLLKPASCAELYAPPAPPVSRDADGKLKDSWYGCGWQVRPMPDGKANCWHTGSLPGTSTFLARLANGLSYAMLFNQRSDERKLGDDAIDSLLGRAANSVTDWLAEDLFSRFP